MLNISLPDDVIVIVHTGIIDKIMHNSHFNMDIKIYI